MKVDYKREFVAGLTTFLTMSYIVLINPAILATDGTGLSFQGVMTATVLLSFICTLMMGLYAKLPYAVAPGMGINAFFTYSLILGQNIPWPVALGMVFWSGVIFLILSVTPVREAIVRSMPTNIRHATAVGIGIFLTFIGLRNAEIVRDHPITLVTFGIFKLETLFVVIGLVVIAFLARRKSAFAFLAGIGVVTLLSWLSGRVSVPESLVSMPEFSSVFFKADLINSLSLGALPAIMSIMFTDLFDSISTFMGLSQVSGLVDEKGDPKNVREALIVDSFATGLAGLFGTSSGTAYIESAAGIEAGGRTGWTAIFAALFFLPCFFIGPMVQMVPAAATAPVLIVVGFLMFSPIQQINFKKIEEALPAFLTLILIPLTFSITEGLLWGLISHVVLYAIAGRSREIPKTLYAVALICVGLLYLQRHQV